MELKTKIYYCLANKHWYLSGEARRKILNDIMEIINEDGTK
jgi:hypothetical protein